MKVTVNRESLAEALALVVSVAPTRTPKPILQCVKLEAKNDQLLLSATDLELGIRYVLAQVSIEREGETLVAGDKISQIIHECNDETMVLESEENICHIIGKDSHFQIYAQDPSEFPAVAEMEGEPDLELEPGVLKGLIEKTLYAAAKENTRYAINGVLWEKDEKKLKLVATDGRRLAHAMGNVSKSVGDGASVIVPSKAMHLFQRLMGGQETVGVRILPTQVLLTCGPATVSSMLVEGHFPKYEDVIPRDCDKRIEFDTNELQSAIRRAALLTNEESKGIRLKFEPEKLVITSRAPEQGEAEVSLRMEYSGPALEVGFNPYFLIDALRVVDSDKVVMELKESNRPGIITTGKDFVYIVMPVNLA